MVITELPKRNTMATKSFAELCEMSASKGGMEKTVKFTYDEHVSVVMAAFRERSQGPHPLHAACPPRGHPGREAREARLDGTDTESWAMRYRRFFAENDAPPWVKKISGGEYLRGTERIEWSEPAGKMVMYTVNESHSQLVTAEEVASSRRTPNDRTREPSRRSPSAPGSDFGAGGPSASPPSPSGSSSAGTSPS